MAAIRVDHTIGDLASDMRKIVLSAPPAFKRVVRSEAIRGNNLAKGFARRQHSMNSRYDIHYPKSFTWEIGSYYGYGAGNITAEYGPDASRPQGGMSFEHGSRNQPPHLDLNKSADVIRHSFAANAGSAAAGLFWPGTGANAPQAVRSRRSLGQVNS